MQRKRKVESSLSRLFFNRQKQEKLIIKKRRDGETKRKCLDSELKDLEGRLKALESAENDDSVRHAAKGVYGCYPSELPKYFLLPDGYLSAII